MNNMDFKVRISPDMAVDKVIRQVENGSVSGELIDQYVSKLDEEHAVYVLVFEKFFMRNSSRASLTVTIENLNGTTHVHSVGSGGGQGAIFKFDWGASESFINQVKLALQDDMY